MGSGTQTAALFFGGNPARCSINSSMLMMELIGQLRPLLSTTRSMGGGCGAGTSTLQ